MLLEVSNTGYIGATSVEVSCIYWAHHHYLGKMFVVGGPGTWSLPDTPDRWLA